MAFSSAVRAVSQVSLRPVCYLGRNYPQKRRRQHLERRTELQDELASTRQPLLRLYHTAARAVFTSTSFFFIPMGIIFFHGP